MKAYLPPKENFIGKTIDGFPGHRIERHAGSGANAHVFRAYDPTTKSVLAFKFVPRANLVVTPDPERYLEEAKRANQLENEAVVHHHRVVEYKDENSETDCIVFVCDFVEGKSLREYISKKSLHEAINISFILGFLETILGLLYELDQVNLVHGDLHSGNVIVNQPRFSLTPALRFRITDFGIRRLSTQTSVTDDCLSAARLLNELLSCITYSRLSSRDRFYFTVIRDELKRHLLEEDSTRDEFARSPMQIFGKMNRIEGRYREEREANLGMPVRLDSPFDYPNSEQIGKSHLLLQSLYSSRLLGLEEIASRSNMVLTGPRGCGKTTVFRALSLDYLSSTGDDDPDNTPYIGIYYGCDDLYFAFPRYRRPDRQELIDVPVHFIVVTLMSRLLEQLSEWALKYFEDEWRQRVGTAASRLWSAFGWSPPTGTSATELTSLIRHLRDRERLRAADKHRYGHDPSQSVGRYLSPDAMITACTVLREEFSFLRTKPFHFFVDDYSKPKISEDLQLSLNRLFLLRTEGIFFKLSTESPVSFARRDVDGKNYVEGREFEFVNLGLRYITDSSSRPLRFLEDIFVRRFGMVDDYPVSTLDQLLGSFPRNENALARVFRDEASESDKSQHAHYAGKETIAAMCSGDIHYVIRLVARMVDEFGGRDALRVSTSSPAIPPQEQTKAIRAAAGSFMESIRTLPGVGSRLSDVVGAFGQVAHSYLVHRTAKNETSRPAHQASRIEPYETLRLSPDAQQILDELLRYSIFIEDPRGKSRRGRIVPRYYLRRYLIPHFNLTFSKRDSIELGPVSLQDLLLTPDRFESRRRLREYKPIWDSAMGSEEWPI